MNNYYKNNKVDLIPRFNIKDVREENKLDVEKLQKRLKKEHKTDKKFKIVYIANRKINIEDQNYEVKYKHGRNFSEFLKQKLSKEEENKIK